MARRVATLVLTALALAVFGWAEPARACSCAGYRSAYEHLKATDVVFRGTVARTVRAPGQPNNPAEGRPMMHTTFTGVRVHRGATTRTVAVRHPEDICCICGLSFTPGEEAVVFAHRGEDGRLSASSCGQAQFDWPQYQAALERMRREARRSNP
jgi:hypothetical protein